MPGLNDYQVPRDDQWEYTKTTPYTNRHEMLTGSQLDGRAFLPGIDYTCNNWTSNSDPAGGPDALVLEGGAGRPHAQIGFPDRSGGNNGSWNSSHGTTGCSQAALNLTHGVGREQLVSRPRLEDEDVAVLAGDINLSIRGDR